MTGAICRGGMALILAVAAWPAGTDRAEAQTRLTVAGYGGSYEQNMRENIIPPFEAAHGVIVDYVAGQSTATLARLQSQRGNQEIDVAIIDDGPMYQAVEFGLCAPIERTEVFDDLYDIAAISDTALAYTIGVTGLVYNTEIFDAEGWDHPTSWLDLRRPELNGRIALLGANSTTGLHGLIMVARAAGGGEQDIEPGFEIFTNEIAPNLLTFAASAPNLEQLLQSEEIAVTVIAQARSAALARAELPVRFVYPEEGAPLLSSAVCPVSGSPQPELAQLFIQHLISPEIQRVLALHGYAPMNRETELSEEEIGDAPVGDEAVAGLVVLDWDTINANRPEWTQRWNREVER